MNTPIRVLLVDDSPYFLEAARDFLQFQEALEMAGAATNAEEAIAQSQKLEFDIVLLDLNLARSSGLDLIPIFKKEVPDAKIIVLTMMEETSYRAAAMQAGADAFVPKNDMGNRLVTVIHGLMGRSESASSSVWSKEAERRGGANFEVSLDDISELICRFRPDGTLTYVNNAYCRYYGMSREELIGSNFISSAADDFPQKLEEHFKSFTPERPTAAFEQYDILPNGEKRWREWVDRAFFDKDGNIVEFQSTGRDITERKRAEEELNRSQAQLSGVIHSTMDALITIDEDYRITLFNPAAEQMFRCPASEAVGSPLDRFIPDSARGKHLGFVQAYGRSGETRRVMGTRTLDMSCLRADGTSFPGEISISQFEVNGRKTFIASIRDVTERKRAEEALRESEQRYRDIFNGVQDAIFVESRDLRILAVNDRACEMFGYSREEFLTKTVADLVPPGQPIMMGEADSISPTPIETYNLRANGERFPIEISGRMQTINGEDILLIIVRDITERKQAEDEIRRMKEFDETLLNNMSEGIVVQNADGYFIYANPAAAAMSGYPLEEFLGAHWTKYFPANQHEIIKKADDLRARGGNSQYEIDFLHRNGKRVNILVSGSPILESGRFNGSIAVFTDISERKQAEEQIQRQLKRLNALRMIDIAISSSFDLTFILDIVLQHVLLQLGADAAAVLLLSPNLQTLEYAASLGFLSEAVRNANVKIGEGYAGRAVLERRLIHISRLMESKGELAEALRTANDGFADYYVAPLIVKGEVKGALEVYHRSDLDPDPEWLDFMETLAGQAAIAIDNAQLLVTIQRSNRELMTAYDATIAGWSHAMDLRDKETEGHTLRVTELTLLLAERMGINQQELIHMRRGALLHDIGKLGVPDHILLKSDTLTEEEWEIMRQHPTYAYEMLLPINYLHPALDIPHAHHEKWDGSGYPRKLKAEQIPLAARLFAVVDVWDALRSDRPYRGKWSVERTREYIFEQSGKHFDPRAVEVFLKMLDESPEWFQ